MERVRRSVEAEWATFSKKVRILLAIGLLGFSLGSALSPERQAHAQSRSHDFPAFVTEASKSLKEVKIPWDELVPGRYYYGLVHVSEPVKFLRQGPSLEHYGTFKHWFGDNSFMRFEKSDTPGWVLVVRDDDTNSFLPSLKRTVKAYMPYESIEVIDADTYSDPIEYVTTPENEHRKFVVVEKSTREVTLFEGGVAIVKFPVIINSELTPVGVHQIYKRKLQANMPSVYGVGPGIGSLEVGGEDTGFALHGSRGWRDWDHITYKELMSKNTHGCMNLPSWDDFDVFEFRWLGGQKNPDFMTLEMVDNGPHVFIVDTLEQLKSFPMTRELTSAGYKSWEEVILRSRAIEVSAPDSFYQE